MANFKSKIKNKRILGNKQINSDEAIGLSFSDEKNAKLVNINISALTENPYQPRKKIDIELIKELSESIKQNGLLQPIVVTPIDKNPNKFYIVAGHRRVEATKILNNKAIRAIIINMNENELHINALVENLQRENLTALEEAFAIQGLVQSGLKQSDIVEKIGKSKSVISKYLKITTLDPELIKHITETDSQIGSSILYEISALPNDLQLKAFLYITKKSLNREQIRNYIKQLEQTKKVSPAKLDNGFLFSHKKNIVTFKLNLDVLQDKEKAITALENLLLELKK